MALITIIGSGMMGSAMAVPAADNGHQVNLVGTPLDRGIIASIQNGQGHPTLRQPLPQALRAYQPEQMAQALEGCDLLIGGVSSFGVDWFVQTVLPLVPDHLPILMITKGLRPQDNGSLLSIPHDMERISGRDLKICAVGGPCICFELAQRQHTRVAFCGENLQVLQSIRSLLATPYYHVSLSTDVIGIECAVAMKNAYALGVSLAIGLAEAQYGEGCPKRYNPQAALFGQSVRESMQLIRFLGGEPENTSYAAGDLYVTIFGGRTRRLGTLLGRGLTFAQAEEKMSGITLESVSITRNVVRALAKLSNQGHVCLADYPLLVHIHEILEGSAVQIPWESFVEKPD